MQNSRVVIATIGIVLAASLAPCAAHAAANALAMSNAVYDRATSRFGSAALSGGYGVSPAGASAGGNAFTWEAWVKLPAAPGAPVVALGSAAAGYIGANAQGAAVCNVATGNTTLTGPAITDGRWHLLDLVGGPSGVACYVDGAVVGTSPTTENVPTGLSFGLGTMGLYPGNNVWTGEIDEASIWSVPRYAGPFVPPASPYLGTEPGLVSLWPLNGTGVDFANDAVLPPNSSSILYSPLNWTAEPSTASTINAGAYFRTMFTGNACDLNFDTSDALPPYSEIYTRVDGYEAGTPWTRTIPGANVPCTPSPDLAAAPWHLVEVVVKSTSQTINRWNASQPGTVVRLAGITLAPGAIAQLPYAAPWSIAVFGDSITEGVRTVNQTAANDTDQNDAMMGWAYDLGQLTGAEVGVIGFGGQGFSAPGSGNVPALPTSFSLMSSGVPRNTNGPRMNLIVVNMGSNDPATTNVASAAVTVLNGLLSSYPGTPIALMIPFDQAHASDLATAAATCAQPNLVSLVQTAGLVQASNGLDSLGLHPTGPNNLGIIAPRLAAALLQVEYASNPFPGGATPGLN